MDVMQARLSTGRPLHCEVSNVSVHDIDSPSPMIVTSKSAENTNSLAISSRAAMGSTGSAARRWATR